MTPGMITILFGNSQSLCIGVGENTVFDGLFHIIFKVDKMDRDTVLFVP